LPLLFQPGYWQTKSMGLISNNPELIQTGRGVALHIFSNFVDAFYSYLYTPQESHLVPVGYVDLLSAVFILIGLALTFKRAPRQPFAIFVLLSFLWLLIAAGVSHDRRYPPTTRMFLLLPWWAYFAAEGLNWLAEQVQALRITRWSQRRILTVLVVGVIGLSLYQAYSLSLRRTAQYQTMEALFLGMVQRLPSLEPTRAKPLTFMFLTNADWGIDGLYTLFQAYDIPVNQARLFRQELDTPILSEAVIPWVNQNDTLVILQPDLAPEWQGLLGAQLKSLGKEPCDIKEYTKTDTRFTLWHSPETQALCNFPH
jgi:hypothetical protein